MTQKPDFNEDVSNAARNVDIARECLAKAQKRALLIAEQGVVTVALSHSSIERSIDSKTGR